MKKSLLGLFILMTCSTTYGQATFFGGVKDPYESICKSNKVYVLLSSIEGQHEAISPLEKTEILERLNNEVQFLKKNLKYKDQGLIRIVINCKGKVVKSKIYNKTKNEELDNQIKEVFNTLGQWGPGKLDGKNVNSSKLFRFKIEEGKFTFYSE